MKNLRMFSGLITAIVLLSVASASFIDYDVSIDVVPSAFFENNGAIVVGYLNITDLSKVVPSSSLSLKIVKGITTELSYSLSDIVYVNDINKSELLTDGLFYKRIEGLTPGIYTAVVYIDGEPKNSDIFEVLSGRSNLTMNFLGATQSQGSISSIINLNYTGIGTVDADLFFYGRKNFASPAKVTETGLLAGAAGFNVPKSDITFAMSDFAGSNQTFAFIVYANSSNGNMSRPDIVVMRTGVKSSVNDASFSIVSRSLRKGSNEALNFTLLNNGSLSADFTLSASGSLASMATVPSTITLAPSSSVSDFVYVNLPRSLSASSGNLTIDVKVDNVLVESKTITFSLLTAEPTHNITVKNVTLDKSSNLIGESISGFITLKNDGDYADEVNVVYGCTGYAEYNAYVPNVAKGKEVNVTFYINNEDVPSDADCELVVKVSNNYFDYSTVRSVNVEAINYAFMFYASKDSIVSRDSITETFSLVLRNNGNIANEYMISALNYANYVLSSRSIVLNPGESTIVNATVSMPLGVSTFNVTFTACSSLNATCRNDTVVFNIFKTEPVVNRVSNASVSNTSLSADVGKGVIYTFQVVNNKLLATNYQLSYVAPSNVSLSVYPGVNFTVQPGSTERVFLHASSEDAGSYVINYTMSEGSNVLLNGSLMLRSGSSDSGVTGFAVAAGSVLGIAGLVVLILFVYFYFIRKPPHSDDEFRPVEVKKADLIKPSVKNDSKYW